MQLPFSESAFLDVFGAYNAALWPAAMLLWLASALALVAIVRGRKTDPGISGLLAVHWAWSGAAYHMAFFARINPAARIFAGLFFVQAALFAWLALSPTPIRYQSGHSTREIIGITLAAYGLLYPLIAIALVHAYPRTPTFGVPCPTTLFTAGLLLLSAPRHRWLFIIPAMWSAIGASAATLVGITPDFALFAAAAALLFYSAVPWRGHGIPRLAAVLLVVLGGSARAQTSHAAWAAPAGVTKRSRARTDSTTVHIRLSNPVEERTYADSTSGARRSPLVAGFLGIVPGLGHVYSGEPGRGLAVFGIWLGSGMVAFSTSKPAISNTAGVVYLGSFVYSIADGAVAAERFNTRHER